jgi:hypothetical protein
MLFLSYPCALEGDWMETLISILHMLARYIWLSFAVNNNNKLSSPVRRSSCHVIALASLKVDINK